MKWVLQDASVLTIRPPFETPVVQRFVERCSSTMLFRGWGLSYTADTLWLSCRSNMVCLDSHLQCI